MRGLKKISIALSFILLGGVLSSCGKKEDTIKIATKPMTEQFVLSEMLKLIIEDKTDLKVEITKGIGGGTSNIHPAIVKGDFHMYPEYTGTGWRFVLKDDRNLDDEELFKELKKRYEEEYDLTWTNSYGFNNNFGLVVGRDIAEKYNIKTYSDLSKYSKDLIFGAEYDFYEREDGYEGLKKVYGFDFKKTVDLDIGLKHKAINEKKIDVMNVFTTDGALTTSEVVLLEDDKKFYDTYYCSTVVRLDILEKYPELKAALALMDNIINEEEMAKLNYKVEGEGKEDKDVAYEFLKEKGIIK